MAEQTFLTPFTKERTTRTSVNKMYILTHCILDNFHAFLSSADIFQN